MFFSGVVVLTISNIVIKLMGLLLKVPLTNMIGDTGMGYFNLAYAIYKWFYMVSTAGLPVAISIMVSESRTRRREKEIKKDLQCDAYAVPCHWYNRDGGYDVRLGPICRAAGGA